MTDQNNGGGDVPANAAPGDGADAMPGWAQSLVKRIDDLDNGLGKRFDGFVEKRESARAKAAEQAKAEPKAITIEDLNAARRFERLAAKHPDEARERFDQLAEQHGFAQAALIIEMAQSLAPKAEASPVVRATPKGIGATQATNNIVGPASQKEARELTKTPEGRTRVKAWIEEGGDVHKLPLA